MGALKRRLARAVARLIVSDPVAVEIVATAMAKTNILAGMDRIREAVRNEVTINTAPGVTPEQLQKALASYDAQMLRQIAGWRQRVCEPKPAQSWPSLRAFLDRTLGRPKMGDTRRFG